MRTAEFYDDYWHYRKSIGKIETCPGTEARARLRIASQWVQPQDGRTARVLDLGCGEGAFGKLLMSQPATYEVVGVDVSSTALELAEPYYDTTVRCDLDRDVAVLGDLGLDSFDCVVALEVLEHLRYPEVLLKILARECAPETTFVFSFPNIAWYGYRKQLLLGRLPKDWFFSTSEHLHWFTVASFSRMLERCHLKVDALDAEYVWPRIVRRFPGLLLRLLQPRFTSLFAYQVVARCSKLEDGDT